MYLLYASEHFACVCTYAPSAWLDSKSLLKRVSGPLELELLQWLWTITWVLGIESLYKSFHPLSLSLSRPHRRLFLKQFKCRKVSWQRELNIPKFSNIRSWPWLRINFHFLLLREGPDTETLKARHLQEGRLERNRAIKQSFLFVPPGKARHNERMAWTWHVMWEQGRRWKEMHRGPRAPFFLGILSKQGTFPFLFLTEIWAVTELQQGTKKSWAMSMQCRFVPLCQAEVEQNFLNYFLIMVAVSAVKEDNTSTHKWPSPKLKDQDS